MKESHAEKILRQARYVSSRWHDPFIVCVIAFFGKKNERPETPTQAPVQSSNLEQHQLSKVPNSTTTANTESSSKNVSTTDKAGVASLYPNPALTIGAVLTTDASGVCVSGYSATVRDVPLSEKEQV
jgi:hypothetical protein